MALSDIAFAVPRAAVASTMALRTTNKAAFRTAVLTAIKNRFPVAAANLTVQDLTSLKVVPLDHPLLGYVGFGRGPDDALAACRAAWLAANPGLNLPAGA